MAEAPRGATHRRIYGEVTSVEFDFPTWHRSTHKVQLNRRAAAAGTNQRNAPVMAVLGDKVRCAIFELQRELFDDHGAKWPWRAAEHPPER